MSELDVLRTLRDQIVPPPLDALRETAHYRSRRDATAVVMAAAAAVVVVAGATILAIPNDPDSAPHPVDPPQGVPDRPLTYADGPTIHYGDQTVDAGDRVVELDLTDDGVAFRTVSGRIGFTDGATIDELGSLGELGPAYEGDVAPLLVHAGWMVSAHTGSRVAWFEFPEPGEPEVVVYDTAAQEVLARAPVTSADAGVNVPYLVSERFVYWLADTDPGREASETQQLRLDPESGDQTAVTPADVQEDLLGDGPERTVLISHGEGDPPGTPPEVTDGTDRNFAVGGGRITPLGAQPLIARDGLTGARFSFEAPAGFPNTSLVWLSQWRDDETIVLLAALPKRDDLLTCHIDTRTCEVSMSGPSSIVVPELG